MSKSEFFTPEPFSPEERRIIVNIAKARVFNRAGKWPPLAEEQDQLRWDATLRELEQTLVAVTKELSAVTKERNEYHRVADAWIPDFSVGQDDLADVAGAQWDRQGFIS